MEPDDTKKDTKRLYEKPRLRTIELAADEVLSAGCKTASTGGMNPLMDPCLATSCFDLGS